jgi:hypothetical protein
MANRVSSASGIELKKPWGQVEKPLDFLENTDSINP